MQGESNKAAWYGVGWGSLRATFDDIVCVGERYFHGVLKPQRPYPIPATVSNYMYAIVI